MNVQTADFLGVHVNWRNPGVELQILESAIRYFPFLIVGLVIQHSLNRIASNEIPRSLPGLQTMFT